VTDLVTGWVNGSISEYGFLLKSASEGTLNTKKTFMSSDYDDGDGFSPPYVWRPYFEINYGLVADFLPSELEDGQIAVTRNEYGNIYTREKSLEQWRLCNGNTYASESDFPTISGGWVVVSGTRAYDDDIGEWKEWDGTVWSDISVGAHTHTESDIINLGDYATSVDLFTTSGTLQTQIDGKSDTSHTHDDRYYTEDEVVTISGTLQNQIDGKPDTLLELTDTPSVYDNGKYLRSTVSGIEWFMDVSIKSFFGTTQGLEASPDIYLGGYYEAPATDANLTQAGTTITYGTINKSQAGHAFLVAAAVGVTDGSDLVITVSGISITDAAVRTPADSEIIVSNATTMSTNEYFETSKKWLGQIIYILSSTSGTVFNADFNYGFCKYDDYGNRDFKITDFECVGFAGTNDTDLDIILYHHSHTGWIYHTTAFVPGGTVVCRLITDHSTDDQLINGEHFAYKRSNLTTFVNGIGLEGFVIKVSSSANNAIEYVNAHIGVEL
jgi:hypothetical protein